MKILILTALILTFSVVVLSEPPIPPVCRLTLDKMEKYMTCAREKSPAWFFKEYDDCKNEVMPGTNDVEALGKICKGEETGMTLIMCIGPAIRQIEEELKQVEEECLRLVEA
ncbi:uncharacterized protein LOC111086029 [Limulus polyphemus]|uniref:Uncharacterized protein LOC111086029 n=1 Tax=Limulus polyphemus TaxID=6850 RepID=A0ABM1SHD6_LIMPO|nr:uncharacterized protein LOC111086029 [Limulus polyphemus]